MILTVVLAAKDAPAALIRCCLASFARLVHARDIEIVLVNSGAFPDGVDLLADAFGAFRIIEMEPQGIYPAFNRGVEAAQGQYVLFFGVDDIALPGMDAVIVELLRTGAVYDLFAAASYMQGCGVSAPSRLRAQILFRNWCQQSLFYSRQYLAAHPFDTRYRIQADHKANIEIRADRLRRFGLSREVVAYFSTGGTSQTSYDIAFRRDLPAIAQANFGTTYRLAVQLKQRLADLIKGPPDARC
ncbi:glycosyltransferase family 2 protein [Sphingomonas sp. BT-65]|uniref:glycosyltransferase family 2 protein n=1 Tax=Sphingomonas sp. BT-65 TaxID=2989821 RepID=UPI002235500A|nr:glycosyltransferase family 2 protein [Sphingomonas sp. BT-65]MCW4461890.1 glycosyltransferase family 2 protein [Sphingomonas sp. BT-65]